MKSMKTYLSAFVMVAVLFACDRKDDDVIQPLSPEDYPIVFLLSDEGDADIEDNDEVGIGIEILPVWDAVSRDPEGIVITPENNMRLYFQISDPQGFANLGDYILGGDAIYEIDDCTDSSDEDIDLNFQYETSTGQGSFDWPVGIAEVEVVLEVSETLFDNDQLDPELRGFVFKLTDMEGPGAGSELRLNNDLEFEYTVLDEEAVFGDWEVDHNDPDQWAAFLALFGDLNGDLSGLAATDVDMVEISFGYEAMEVKVELLETEEDECEPSEQVPLEIEIEAEYDFGFDELFGMLSGDLSFEGEYESDDVPFEFVLEGSFEIDEADPATMTLTLSGETEEGDIEEQTLVLNR